MYIFWFIVLVVILFIIKQTMCIETDENYPMFKAKLKVNNIDMAGYSLFAA